MKKLDSFLSKCIFLGITFLSLHSPCAALETPKLTLSSWQEVVAFAKEKLPEEGELIRKADGFVYVKVDDAYIHLLFPLLGLKERGYEEPPYFRSSDSPGAHISVFNEDENIVPIELGHTFHFTVKRLVIVHVSPETNYAILEVDSPELENLRTKYGLRPKLQGHEYHISIAKKSFSH